MPRGSLGSVERPAPVVSDMRASAPRDGAQVGAQPSNKLVPMPGRLDRVTIPLSRGETSSSRIGARASESPPDATSRSADRDTAANTPPAGDPRAAHPLGARLRIFGVSPSIAILVEALDEQNFLEFLRSKETGTSPPSAPHQLLAREECAQQSVWFVASRAGNCPGRGRRRKPPCA